MRNLNYLWCLLITSITYSQTFSGSTGLITDDGASNNYTLTANFPTTTLNSGFGLVKVCLNINHTYDEDLSVQLIAPDGTSINLFSNIGGNGRNFDNTCLSQTASSSIVSGSAPFSNTYKPQQTIGNVNNGQNGNGVWTLRIIDTYPLIDSGILNSWSLEFGSDAPTAFAFTSSNLPIVIINTNGVTIPDEPDINATLKIIYNGEGVVNNVTDEPNDYNGNISIERRGNYSQSLPQKPYKIEIKNDVFEDADASLLGMPSESDWILLANYNDKVFMRNTLAYKLFTDMGHYATRSKYCEVILNGNYDGVYLLMESIKRGSDRVPIAKLTATENSGLDVTGGYIIKNDYWEQNDSWLSNYHPIDHPELDVHLVYHYPKATTISSQQKTYIQGFINDFEGALYSANFADATTGYNKYMDTDSFIDYFIINELSRNNDGFKKSAYFNKDIDSPTALSKLNAGPVWDFDWAWKNIPGCIFSATDGSGWAHEVNDCGPDVTSVGWYVRLLQDQQFQNKLRCRYDYFRSTILSDSALEAFIDSASANLEEAQVRHFERWGNLGVNTGTPEIENDPTTFEGQIQKFKQWIAVRLAWLGDNMPGSSANCDLLTVASNDAKSFRIAPNPASDNIFILSNDGLPITEVAFYDFTGKLALKSRLNSDHSVDVSQLAKGFYICKVAGKNAINSMKVAIMR